MNNQRIVIVAVIVFGLALITFFWFTPSTNRVRGVIVSNKNNDDSIPEKVDLKSAIITLKSTAPLLGSDIEERIYIDDYGNKYTTVTDTKLNYKGQEIVTTKISLLQGGFDYTYDPEKKKGVKSINEGDFNPTKIDFTKLDDKAMQTYGLEKAGHERILGKYCEVYTLNYPAMEMKGRYDVWQNITLHSQLNYGNISIDMLASKIEENVKIPDETFEVPKDVTFTLEQGSSALPK